MSTTKKTDMKKTLDEQHRQEGRHYPVIPHKVPNIETQQVRKPEPTQIRRTEERMKEHIERVLETLKNKSEFLQLELQEKVLATHHDVTVHNNGDDIISVRKGGKTIARGDYDHEGGGFWISHPSHKGQKGFDKADEIAKHYHSVHKEEVEQIDELSKKTLGNYVAKAVVDVHNDARWAGETDDKDAKNKAFKRLLGVKSAAARLSKQNVSGGRISNYRTEEVEQIDEISKKTLGNYIGKAVVDVHNDAKWAGETDDRDAKNKAYKRLLGVKSASARLGGHPISKAQGISGFRREEVELDEKVLATHNDVTVHNVGDGEIHVRKNGKTIAHGDYDHEGGGFWISHHSHKGQKGFNKPDEIAKHYHSVHESEEKERDYIVVHAKKGTHKTTAKTSYEAAKKAASHWRLKSTAGIDAHPAKSDRFMYENVELDESMENLSLKQWSKIHRDHHEFGGGSKSSQRKMSQIEKHVHKKYGKEAMHKMIKDTEDYASGGGSGPVKEEKGFIMDKGMGRSAVSESLSEASTDITLKVVKHNGKPIGEIGIDPEASPGNGPYYVKLYDGTVDEVGFDTPKEAMKELNYIVKQVVRYSEPAPFKGGRKVKSKKSAAERVKKIAKGMQKQYTKEAVQDATTPSNAQETIMKSGGVKALAQSIKAKKRTSDKFDPNPEFVSQVQPNASNY